MHHFSSMTPQEYIAINRDKIPTETLSLFDALSDHVSALEKMIESLKRENELQSEQNFFASTLVNEIRGYAEVRKKSPTSKAILQTIENSSFEI